ncbi:GH39 family glycosyl hydrolase [Sphingomonas morindae]|uniref:Beta-xylosidase n=1 Tax=Sphingomonas morindae TaxID=1541170 RepID=A0ABY4X828_9SPHN|nr:beta-xylosidase [Sphingomonas morindae]USI73024.1 beta-xylosidase [Sphingomonas morindae]
MSKALARHMAAALALVAGTGAAAAATPSAAPAPRAITADLASVGALVNRFFDLSVGSDFPGTLIRPDSQAQLRTAVDELGFRYIRFHAIFHDVLGTVKVAQGRIVYDWTGIDRLYDDLLARHIRPFVELSFTPDALKTSDQTIFYWKGNTSHPRLDGWSDLVDAFVRHVRQRYGAEEVRRWYFEVWNEPNLDGFWEKADQAAYFKLYDVTARSVKAVDPALRVGGPATAGAAWVPEFLAHVAQSHAPIDFVATHSYGVDGGFLDEKGKSDTKLSSSPDAITGDVRKVRAQIKASAFPALPLFFTEWSTSYTPRDLVHDSYVSAPYILTKLHETEPYAQGMSYWTYTDLFEEPGPPPTPFHGGFGLMNREGIRKPAWFAYKYLHALRGRTVAVADPHAMVAVDGRRTTALLWDWHQPVQAVSNRPFYSRLLPAAPSAPVALRFAHVPAGRYHLRVQRTGFRANDPMSAYIDMGMPETLAPDQLAKLQALTADRPEQDRVIRVDSRGAVAVPVAMRTNDVVLVTLEPVEAAR